ncbi:MYCBP-associated protein [Aplochiton taeniatus]
MPPEKNTGKTSKKEARPRSPPDKKRPKASEEFSCVSEEQPQSPTLKGEDIQALAIRPDDLEKLRVPQPPKEPPKPEAMTRVLVRKTRPPDDVRKAVTVAVARPLVQEPGPQPLDYTGPGGPRFDAQGMVLPHSILGSLEGFRREMEARGETELVSRIPEPQRGGLPQPVEQRGGAAEGPPTVPPGRTTLQSHALEHWHLHMSQRLRQQDLLSNQLQKPVGGLLMNQSNRFRETQEQRELLSRALPTIHHGHGYRVGSEFWSLPQRFGDEVSGISATLTQSQRGQQEPVTHIGQPSNIRRESGGGGPQSSVSFGRAWDQSLYLQHRQQELRDVLRELDFNQPDIDGLEVIGSGQPYTSVPVKPSPLVEEKEQQENEQFIEEEQENYDPLAQFDDVMKEPLLIPALRFCGQPARWTGNDSAHKGEVGISARVTFESVAGERACSDLELQNEGSTAVYYSWQRQPQPHSFPDARTRCHTQHFYFNTSTGVILPGDTQRVEFLFKSEVPGIRSEVWQLNTHPVLLGGASIQVTLRGVALYQDKTAHQRMTLEKELQHKEAVSVCRSMVRDILQGVLTPERPGSPAELYTTEEEHFLQLNPKLQYLREPVEALKKLWQRVAEATGEKKTSWDLSVHTLRQAVLSLPREEPPQEPALDSLTQERVLAQLNLLLLQLSLAQLQHTPRPLHTIGLQLWRELLDGLASEALWLRHQLGLPEVESWTEHTQDLPHHPHHDTWDKTKEEEKNDKKGGAAPKDVKKGGNNKEKEEKKGAAKPAVKEKVPEDRPNMKKKGKGEEVGKRPGAKPGKDLGKEASSLEVSHDSDKPHPHMDVLIEPEVQAKYRRRLHQQVYVLMQGMVDSLCELVDDEAENMRTEP